MKNKEIQEERVRGYFIQAANEILRGEGISNLSVRNVAEKAGYSYATLYNYFKNIDELLSVCIFDFIEEGKIFILKETKNIPKGKDKLEAIIKSYIKFFIQYPGIFELFYSAKLNGKNSRELIVTFLEELCSEDWNYLISEGKFTEEEVSIKKDTIKYVITGLLVLYNNLHFPNDYEQFQFKVKTQIESII